jgi:hypothetical protein
MRVALFMLLPLAAQAQFSIFTFDGTTETPVGATYNYGNIAIGSTETVRFRIFTTTAASVTVDLPIVSGAGFVNPPVVNGSVPYVIAGTSASPLNFFEFSVTFDSTQTNGTAGTYSASLQIPIAQPTASTVNILLVAAIPSTSAAPGQPPMVVPSGAGCSASSSTSFTFAATNIGSPGSCTFNLTNPNSFAIMISSIAVSGDPAFSLQPAPTFPLSLAANSSTPFTLQIKPVCGQDSYSGAVTIASSYYSNESFTLTGSGITPGLPTPMLVFDTQTFSSMQQHTLSIQLPQPSICGANGYVNLAFTPAANLPDDSTIVFLSGSTRSLPFSIPAGSAQVSISGSQSANFATGSTAGTLSFSLSGVTAAGALPTPSFTLAPAPIVIDSAVASNQVLGQLNITVIGFDNTYSAGQMTFTFFDGNNQQVGQPIPANFTSSFQTFYSGQQMGSTFLMQVSFPVLGSCVPAANMTCLPNQVIASVQATLTNSAGQTQTGSLTFQ